jgi:hypothetical protein
LQIVSELANPRERSRSGSGGPNLLLTAAASSGATVAIPAEALTRQIDFTQIEFEVSPTYKKHIAGVLVVLHGVYLCQPSKLQDASLTTTTSACAKNEGTTFPAIDSSVS